MALNKLVAADIENRLKIKINQTTPVSGGSINQVYRVETSKEKFLLKVNSRCQFPFMFQREREGLQAIAGTNTIAVPNIILQGDIDDDSYLLLEWVAPAARTVETSQLLGRQLAAMHLHTAPRFGFATNNYMGSLKQSNTWHTNWTDFFY